MPTDQPLNEHAVLQLWREAFGEPPVIVLEPRIMLQMLSLYRLRSGPDLEIRRPS